MMAIVMYRIKLDEDEAMFGYYSYLNIFRAEIEQNHNSKKF